MCLASTSPARLMLLQQFGIRPLTIAPDVDEEAVVEAVEASEGRRLAADEHVLLLARRKAAEVAARLADDLPGFEPPQARSWLVDIPSDREHYLSLISTYSTTLRLPDENRAGLFACIGELLDREFGGRITKRYRFDLVVRRRHAP